MNQFLHYVAAIFFFCMSAKYNVYSQSTLYMVLKTLEKSTHFMLTRVLMSDGINFRQWPKIGRHVLNIYWYM